MPCWNRSEWRTPKYLLALSRLQQGCGGPIVLPRSADLVWRSLKNTLSHGTLSISCPWSATSFLAVFWQVCPCSRPDSGSSEAHENKQYIKTLLSNYSMFKKTRNYSAILGLGQYFNLNNYIYSFSVDVPIIFFPTNSFLGSDFY